jgi:hypothetical protein
VSGATHTSQAILAAAEDCLKQAGFDIAALKTKKVAAKGRAVDSEKTADIIIVGGGGAGLAAAVSASSNGASVIVLEKMGAVGGNTIVCGGIYNCPDPALQDPEGIEDSPAFYAKQTWEGGDKVADKALVDVLCYNAYDGLQWLKGLGLKFSDKISQGAGSLYRRTHGCLEPMGTGYIRVYMEDLPERSTWKSSRPPKAKALSPTSPAGSSESSPPPRTGERSPSTPTRASSSPPADSPPTWRCARSTTPRENGRNWAPIL